MNLKSEEAAQDAHNPAMAAQDSHIAAQKSLEKILAQQKAKTHQTTQQIEELEFLKQQDVAENMVSEDNMVVQKHHHKKHAENNNKKEADSKAKTEKEAKAKAEKAAVEKINKATLAGIKTGEEASKKLHANAKHQSVEQTTNAIDKLKTKYDKTREQVLAIVNNFGQIHSDLQELKSEYMQEQNQINLLQLGASGTNLNAATQSEKDLKITNLQNRLKHKKIEVLKIVQDFRKIHSDLSMFKGQFDEDKKQETMELSMLKSQEEDTQLSKVFEMESKRMQERDSLQV